MKNRAKQPVGRSLDELIGNSSRGLAVGEIIYDTAGIPADFSFLYVNPALEMISEIPVAEMLGRSFMELFMFWDERLIRKGLQQVASGESFFSAEAGYIRGRPFGISMLPFQGNRFFLNVQERVEQLVVYRDDGSLVQTACSSKDPSVCEPVSEKKPEFSDFVLIHFDKNGMLLRANEAAGKWFDLFRGRDDQSWHWMPGHIEQKVRERIALLTPDDPVAEHLVRHPLNEVGGERWVEWRLCGVFSEAGELMEIITTGKDVTFRMALEQRSRMEDLLRRQLVDAGSDAVFVFRAVRNPDGNIVDFEIILLNAQANRLLGCRGDDMSGKLLTDVPLTGATDLFGDFCHSINQQTGLDREMSWENGRTDQWMHVRAFPMEDDQLAVYIRDITAEKWAEHVHEEQMSAIMRTEKMATLGTLVAGIAHEINNPNNVITLNAPFLRKIWSDVTPVIMRAKTEGHLETVLGMPTEEILHETPELLSGIERSAERIKRIVHLLKDYVRGSSSGDAFCPVQLNDVVLSASELVRNKIRHSTERFECDLDQQLSRVRGDFQLLEQVIINLLVNACEALPSPDKGISIRTRRIPEENRIELKVCDEGSGIAPDVLRRLGDPFLTTKQKIGGTGLGVSICMNIIQEHHGTMQYESEQGRGTMVTVMLPSMDMENGAV